MSDDFGFAPVPFKPDDAVVSVQRALRDLKLAARGNGFELRGKRVAELDLDGAVLHARIARRPMLSPEWDRFEIHAAPDQRKFIDEVKKRLARWEREE